MKDEGFPDSLPLGTVVGGYKLARVIGQGGFGITYEATSAAGRVARKVAIKEFFCADYARRPGSELVLRSGVDRGEYLAVLEKFEAEARKLVDDFDHPNIVRGENLILEHGSAFLVMEFVDGPTLKAWLEEAGRPPGEADLRAIMEPILDAVAYLHDRGEMHRDLNPKNILLRRRERGGRATLQPVLIDFGAVGDGLDIDRNTVSLQFATKAYGAPEQLLPNLRRQGRYTDIFALGGVLYRAVTGQNPPLPLSRWGAVYGAEPSPDPYISAADRAEPGAYTPQFLAGIDRALALDARARPQTIAEFRDALGWAGAPEPAETVRTPAISARSPEPAGDATTLVSPEASAAAFSQRAAAPEPAPTLATPLHTPEKGAPVGADPATREGATGGRVSPGDSASRRSRSAPLWFAAAALAAVGLAYAASNTALFRRIDADSRPAAPATALVAPAQPSQPAPAVNPALPPTRPAPLPATPAATTGSLTLTRTIPHGQTVTTLTVDRQGRGVLVGDTEGKVTWRGLAPDSNPIVLAQHTGWVRAIDAAPDGARFASIGEDEKVAVAGIAVRSAPQRPVITIPGTKTAASLAFVAEGRRVLAGGGGVPSTAWDLASGTLVETYQQIATHARFAVLADRQRVVTNNTTAVLLVDVTRQNGAKEIAPANDVRAIHASDDGAVIVIHHFSETVTLLAGDGRKLASVKPHASADNFPVHAVTVDPRGRWFATTGKDRMIKLWSTADARLLASVDGGSDSIWALAASPDGTLLVSAGLDEMIKVWQVGVDRP